MKKTKRSTLYIWLVIVLCILLVFIGLYISWSNQQKDLEDSQVQSSPVQYSPRDQAIIHFLLTQRALSWKTQLNGENFCLFDNLDPSKELFPLFLWIACGEFSLEGNVARQIAGVSLPIVIDYPNELSFFDLNKFSIQIPRDGSLYIQDIKSIFPSSIQNKIITYDGSLLQKQLITLATKKLVEDTRKSPITVTGKIICLTHRDIKGPQTMECAYGLRDAKGKEYGIRDETMQFITNLPMDTDVTISGKYLPLTDSKYKAEGTIEIESVID